ncbi:MAG: hypothetical protein IT238_01355 [Bacteroidia bacterium]|nr:hypothetical protein [Bacteroidia bacterium]MCZ2247622.1 hypothetical protein [Bacteroidia bacterium]
MKVASSNEIKKALQSLDSKEVVNICMTLAKYKKDNKELLSFLLFESDDIHQYMEEVKGMIDDYFDYVEIRGFKDLIKKIRKIIRLSNKYIKYSSSKRVEVDVSIHLCRKLVPFVKKLDSVTIKNIYIKQLDKIEKSLSKLEEDLQFDYINDLENLKRINNDHN